MSWIGLTNKLKQLNVRYIIVYQENKEVSGIIKLEDKLFIGNSYCSPKDKYDVNMGRLIALGRAYKRMNDGIDTTHEYTLICKGKNCLRVIDPACQNHLCKSCCDKLCLKASFG
jgi:hypothetical protein